MSDRADPFMQAAGRLEAAVDRLADALAHPRPHANMVPRGKVEALTRRLEATIARLKGALHDQDAAGAPNDDERED